MERREYLEFFLKPLLNSLNSKKVLKKNITRKKVSKLRKHLRCEKTRKFLESVRKNQEQHLNNDDIPKLIQKKMFLALIIAAKYEVKDFFGEAESVKFLATMEILK